MAATRRVLLCQGLRRSVLRIIAADVDDNKLQHAKALGADDMVNNRNASEAAEHIQEITGPGELAWSSIALGRLVGGNVPRRHPVKRA